MKRCFLILVFFVYFKGYGVQFSDILKDSRKWNEVELSIDAIQLAHGEPDFKFGVSTCTYQDSGAYHCPRSQWAVWEKSILPKENRSGCSADFYRLYQTQEGRNQIIRRLKKLGVNSYRFSIEWSQIQSSPNAWNDDVMNIYIQLCKHLRDEGIEPMVTLHHFSEPKWFHKRGSFEKKGNIRYFVNFATRAFKSLTNEYKDKPLVELFCTINEPNIEGFQRYIMGCYSPGKKRNFEKAGHFIKHMLLAHCLAYPEMKNHCPRAQIGIIHQYLKCIPSNTLIRPFTASLNRLINDAPFHFFETKGKFKISIPLLCNIHEDFTDIVTVKTDFVGLQYYVRPVVSFTGSSNFHEPMTNTKMNFREDPEGIYEAIKEVHRAYNAPVIITENGISTHDEKQRFRYMLRSLYAVSQARSAIGKENLLGYYCWSLPHVFEWDYGMRPEAFGLFELLENGKLAENPKIGAASFVGVVQKWRFSLR